MKQSRLYRTFTYSEWVRLQKFQDSSEHHKIVSKEEQDFLQNIIYPMFYDTKKVSSYKSFPLILKEHKPSLPPKYVINTDSFAIVFSSYQNCDGDKFWILSFHVKEWWYCKKRIEEFKNWLKRHYLDRGEEVSGNLIGIPDEYLYPLLKVNDNEERDFCIEFGGIMKDYMLFKFMDLFRIY
ncbi:MAG: hypothetical protein IJ220_02335 [Clostridia bacterium]|nr:hypothetical protein [Clostridia bacterium]